MNRIITYHSFILMEVAFDLCSFALCQSCYWTATTFTNIFECPICHSNKVEFIPLNLDEKYEYIIDQNKGLEVKFSTCLEFSQITDHY